ncbi:hypothetical protein [Haliscomenobacter hydrossis]|uniref:Uncharacterized protein n=1 Tax=Haliscomenobacter hydrossis (strain ATCC 27775 / DSM 1100 / LMG 10767 / O) TaxID=760192 RepID=F4L0G0_HALH1|nr:hypothetical protein [Haliscomenobacter hydrossis]AEE48472.1 hypothetical protein Halhy_0562 [Haliscomenobacter hydrossis DSM 1100]
MKTQTLNVIKLYFMLLCLVMLDHTILQAQRIDDGVFQRKVPINLSASNRDTIRYLEIKDSVALIKLIKILRPENYPVSTIKKPVLDPFFDLILQYESQLDDYRQLDHHQNTLDSIQQMKIAELKQVIQLQEGRVANFIQLNKDLTEVNTQLNQQLNQALVIAKECNKGKVKKQWLTAILGAGVGFSLAGIITSFK